MTVHTFPKSILDLADELGAYYGRDPITAPEPINVFPVELNPRAWPPCLHCGGNVSCDQYQPDTSAPLWGASE